MKFKTEFKRLRLLHNMTQAELAEALQISRSAVCMYESGEREPDFEMIERIADFFNVRIANLMDDKADSYYSNPSTAAIAQEIFENKELRILFDAAKDADPEDLKTVHAMLLALKRKEGK